LDELEAIKMKMLREMITKASTPPETRKVENSPVILTDTNFDAEVSRRQRLVIDFWAEWCQPCKMMSPILERVAKKYAGKVDFGKLNVDENPVTAQRYGVMAIPTLLFFRNGAPVERVIGVVPEAQLSFKVQSTFFN